MGDRMSVGARYVQNLSWNRAPAAGVPAATVSRVAAQQSSGLSEMLGLVRELTAAGPPVDHAAIARIRQAIAQGSYVVDAGSIASALLDQDRIDSFGT